MPTLTLHPIAEADAAEILHFETENRAYFEKSVASFGDDYYLLPTVQRILEARTQDWQDQSAFFYFIRDGSRELVGRINLFGVQYGPAQRAELGYRIAEHHSGKGVATEAVRQVVRNAFEFHGLHRLEAATSPSNVASQIVLLRNGFEFWGRARRSYLLQGTWQDTVMLERHG